MELVEPINSRSSDRRHHPRYPCEFRDEKKQLVRNMNMGGFYLESAASYNLDQEINISIGIPPALLPLALEGKVVYKKTGEKKKFGYGVCFNHLSDVAKETLHRYFVISKNVSLSSTNPSEFEYRVPRYGEELIGNLKIHVFCRKEKDSDPLSAKLINISQHGALIEVPGFSKEFFHHIKDIHITVEGQEVFRGSSKVMHLRKENGSTKLGIIFQQREPGIQEIFLARDRKRFESIITDYSENIQKVTQIDDKFKSVVADCRTLLEGLKQRVREEEKKMEWVKDLAERQRLLDEKLNVIDSHFRGTVQSLLMQLDQIVEKVPEELKSIYRAYYFQNLSHIIQDAPYAKRAYEKPLGYPGDYRLMLYIYDEIQAGTTLWEKVMSNFICTFPAAQAVRNRAYYLKDKIGSIVKSRRRDLKILSIASGPCREVRHYLESFPHGTKTVDFYFVDQDREALQYASSILRSLNTKLKKSHGLHFFDHSLKAILTKPEVARIYPPMDLIYSAGLYDYMDDDTCHIVTEKLYQMLKPGGLLVVGNFCHDNPFKYCQEFSVDWRLNLRSKKQIMEIVPDTIPIANVSLEQEGTGINLFLNIKKK